MKTPLFILLALGGFIMAGPLFAESKYDTDGWRTTKRCSPNDCVRQDCQNPPKFIKHKRMAKMHRQEAMRHRDLARREMMQFRDENFAPPAGPDRPWGPAPHMRNNLRFQDRPFGPGMNPDCPVGPPHERRFNMQKFGPGMNPDAPPGPPQHMRFRDGKRQPRAQ